MATPKRIDIDPEIRDQFVKAAQGMGADVGRQDLGAMGVVQFTPMIYFDSYFGEWAKQDNNILVHLYPRAGGADVWYESRYSDNGRRYVPGRREFKPPGLAFPDNMQDVIEVAASKVTFGDVELSFVRHHQSSPR